MDDRARPLDIGLAIALSADALDEGLADWLMPVADGVFDSVWSLENPLAPQAEALVWLTAAAMICPEARVGTAAIIAPIREPVLLARQAATIDRLTRGRLDLGVTIGRRPEDYEATGAEFHRRGRRLDDAIVEMRRIWQRSDGAPPAGPAPSRPGGPSLLIGGHADAALRRAVAFGDGFLAGATSGPSHALRSLVRLREIAADTDRAVPDRAVANVFVIVGDSTERALASALAIFTERHGGARPPWDPAEVVVAGPVDHVAARLASMHARGFSGLNLVPVDMSLTGVEQVTVVAERLRGLRARP